MSCNEHVLAELGDEIKTSYSRSLLAFATNQRRFSIGILAFGETDTRRRVKNIMRYKKTKKWMGIFSIAIILIVSMLCLTNKQEAEALDVREAFQTASALDVKEALQTASALSAKTLSEILSIPFIPLPTNSQKTDQEQYQIQRMNPERILMLNGKLYYGTTETGPMGCADCVEGQIASSVAQDKIPSQNGESNFGCVGNSYTYDDGAGWIQVFLEDGEYHIFRTDITEAQAHEDSLK